VLKTVTEIYRWLDSHIHRPDVPLAKCRRCGDCCNFDTFDHRLFITTPEVMYLAANLPAEYIKPMTTGTCPYNEDGRCTIYQHRFAGCRIFSCDGSKDFQSQLSEAVSKKLKALCTQLSIPYQYTDLAEALNKLTNA